LRRIPKPDRQFLSTKILLKALYKALNRFCFDGRLPEAQIWWSPRARRHTFRLRPRGGYIGYRVSISMSSRQFTAQPGMLVPALIDIMLRIDCRERGLKTKMYRACMERGRNRISELGFQILED
jgi:hypothetical protein